MGAVVHVWHEQAIEQLFLPGAPTYKEIIRKAVLVQNGARVRVRVDTGRLRNSINITAPIWSGRRPGARIGSNVVYAPFVGTHDCVRCWGDYLREALNDARD